VLEDTLVAQLVGLGFVKVAVTDEASMLANLKSQLGAFNGMELTDGEFTKVLHHLNRSAGVFAKAKTLRDRMKLTKEDGETVYLEFFDSSDPLRNRWQVTQQVAMDGGSYKNQLRCHDPLQRPAGHADRAEAARAGDEGGFQPDPTLPEAQFLERAGTVPLRPALRDQQRGEHEVLRQRPQAVF